MNSNSFPARELQSNLNVKGHGLVAQGEFVSDRSISPSAHKDLFQKMMKMGKETDKQNVEVGQILGITEPSNGRLAETPNDNGIDNDSANSIKPTIRDLGTIEESSLIQKEVFLASDFLKQDPIGANENSGPLGHKPEIGPELEIKHAGLSTAQGPHHSENIGKIEKMVFSQVQQMMVSNGSSLFDQTTSVILELKDELFTGTSLNLKQTSAGMWQLAAQSSHPEIIQLLQQAAPQLQSRFREKKLGSLEEIRVEYQTDKTIR